MSESVTNYDAIILGSGQGGNPLAQKLAGQGLRVALIEERDFGGTCINTGCTPTKTMVACAQVAHYARQANRWGVRTGPVTVDFPAVIERKRQIVEEFRSGWQKKFDKLPTLDVHHGKGRFRSSKQIEVAGQTLSSDRIFVDTGAHTAIPPVDGIRSVPYLTNETIMELAALPDHLVVIGGGYIGLEFGQMFRRFGSQVTIVQSGPHLLHDEEPEVLEELKKVFEAEGIRCLLHSKAKSVEGSGTDLRFTIETPGNDSETIPGSHVLLATGRQPNTADLNLPAAGVDIDEHGFIRVNDRLETSVPGIWAIGDVKGGPAFTHISYNDFQILFSNLYEGGDSSTRDRIVPYAVFTDPQLGRVGLTEADARAAGKQVKVGTVRLTSVARAIERNETDGIMKIVVNAADDHILGASILASNGDEVVQILHALMLARQPYTVLKGAIFIHPTIAEGFFSLLDSVQ